MIRTEIGSIPSGQVDSIHALMNGAKAAIENTMLNGMFEVTTEFRPSGNTHIFLNQTHRFLDPQETFQPGDQAVEYESLHRGIVWFDIVDSIGDCLKEKQHWCLARRSISTQADTD